MYLLQLAQAKHDAQSSKDEIKRIQGDLSKGSDVTSKLQNEL